MKFGLKEGARGCAHPCHLTACAYTTHQLHVDGFERLYVEDVVAVVQRGLFVVELDGNRAWGRGRRRQGREEEAHGGRGRLGAGLRR